jgi:hypothetical protein
MIVKLIKFIPNRELPICDQIEIMLDPSKAYYFNNGELKEIPKDKVVIIKDEKCYEVPRACLSKPANKTYITGILGAIESLPEVTK